MAGGRRNRAARRHGTVQRQASSGQGKGFQAAWWPPLSSCAPAPANLARRHASATSGSNCCVTFCCLALQAYLTHMFFHMQCCSDVRTGRCHVGSAFSLPCVGDVPVLSTRHANQRTRLVTSQTAASLPLSPELEAMMSAPLTMFPLAFSSPGGHQPLPYTLYTSQTPGYLMAGMRVSVGHFTEERPKSSAKALLPTVGRWPAAQATPDVMPVYIILYTCGGAPAGGTVPHVLLVKSNGGLLCLQEVVPTELWFQSLAKSNGQGSCRQRFSTHSCGPHAVPLSSHLHWGMQRKRATGASVACKRSCRRKSVASPSSGFAVVLCFHLLRGMPRE